MTCIWFQDTWVCVCVFSKFAWIICVLFYAQTKTIILSDLNKIQKPWWTDSLYWMCSLGLHLGEGLLMTLHRVFCQSRPVWVPDALCCLESTCDGGSEGFRPLEWFPNQKNKKKHGQAFIAASWSRALICNHDPGISRGDPSKLNSEFHSLRVGTYPGPGSTEQQRLSGCFVGLCCLAWQINMPGSPHYDPIFVAICRIL